MGAEAFPPPDLELLEDVTFSAHGLRLDVLRSHQRSAEPLPAVMHIHGGAWVMFGKWPVANVFLARAGFVTVSVDYRLAPDATFPAQIHDVKTAVRWLRAHADTLGVDPERIGVWGISAGAHLAALLGTTAGHPGLEGLDGGWEDQSSEVQVVGNVGGVMDFLDPGMLFGPEPFPLFGAPLAGRPDLAVLASPVTHVAGHCAPFIHLHGRNDEHVPVSQARRMHAALKAGNACTELVELEGDHFINETHQDEVERRLLAFFRRELAYAPGVPAGWSSG
ncbi:lipase/esterase [Deinococcus aerius]|uniref:Lipase/esterase n=1 Tax=Deinococcus aerius TaxID=200253 RepID=A0A2I9DK17_9DEIO|nr:alpha/beta hydrolase [Deinococcus aerius]GBF05181.1 lipase/esterase [Deinococcus aerius]